MLRGMSHSSRDQLLVVDLTPYDATLPVACVELNAAATATHPTLACVSALWTGKPDENKFINKHLKRKIIDRTASLIRENTLKLPGLPDFTADITVSTGKKPTLDETKFELTAPMSDGTLRFHQAVLDVWGENREFKEVAAEHNKKFNPSGASFKAKREAPDSKHEDDEAVTIDPGSGPKTKDDVKALHTEGLQVIPGSDATWELLIAKTGELFLSGLSDTVVTSTTNLGGFGHGFYEVGDGAAKVKAAHGKWMDFCITDDQAECIFVVNPPLKEKYPDTPQTLRHFLKFLEGQGMVNVKLINHTVTRGSQGSQDAEVVYQVAQQTPSLFEVQQKFTARAKPTRETGCALVDIPKAKSSKHVRFIQSFTCPAESATWPLEQVAFSSTFHVQACTCTVSVCVEVQQGGQCVEAWSLVPFLDQERAADPGQGRTIGVAWLGQPPAECTHGLAWPDQLALGDGGAALWVLGAYDGAPLGALVDGRGRDLE
jgi:hypothetical protein